jgi:hypothetical protein
MYAATGVRRLEELIKYQKLAHTCQPAAAMASALDERQTDRREPQEQFCTHVILCNPSRERKQGNKEQENNSTARTYHEHWQHQHRNLLLLLPRCARIQIHPRLVKR